LYRCVGVAKDHLHIAVARSEEIPMYIGIGTIVLIVVIVLIILALRR